MQSLKHPYLLLETGRKLIGWGTGGVFDYFHSLFPLPLAYLVDNESSNQGTIKNGLEIHSPERLNKEDPRQLVVIIYSSFSAQIMEQLKSYGDFIAISAPVLFCSDYQHQWKRIEGLLSQPEPRRGSIDNNAILIQGQVVPELTLKIAGLYSRRYPDCLRVLSTWQGTEEKLLKNIAPLVDEIVLSPLPEWAGVQNRNLQIVSTREGLRCCQQRGVWNVLKTRSDMFVLAPDVLRQCKNLLGYYDPGECRKMGAANRLIVPESFTRKYIPYSPSDLVMYGTIEDLLRFWSCPLDERRFNLLEACRSSNLSSLGRKGLPAECYFGSHYGHSLNRPMVGDLHDSWDFYRDLFLVTDNSWFELFWPKNPHIPDTIPQQRQRETIGFKFWHALLYGGHKLDEAIKMVDISKQYWC